MTNFAKQIEWHPTENEVCVEIEILFRWSLADGAIAMPIISLTWYILFVCTVDSISPQYTFMDEWLYLWLCDMDVKTERVPQFTFVLG